MHVPKTMEGKQSLNATGGKSKASSLLSHYTVKDWLTARFWNHAPTLMYSGYERRAMNRSRIGPADHAGLVDITGVPLDDAKVEELLIELFPEENDEDLALNYLAVFDSSIVSLRCAPTLSDVEQVVNGATIIAPPQTAYVDATGVDGFTEKFFVAYHRDARGYLLLDMVARREDLALSKPSDYDYCGHIFAEGGGTSHQLPVQFTSPRYSDAPVSARSIISSAMMTDAVTSYKKSLSRISKWIDLRSAEDATVEFAITNMERVDPSTSEGRIILAFKKAGDVGYGGDFFSYFFPRMSYFLQDEDDAVKTIHDLFADHVWPNADQLASALLKRASKGWEQVDEKSDTTISAGESADSAQYVSSQLMDALALMWQASRQMSLGPEVRWALGDTAPVVSRSEYTVLGAAGASITYTPDIKHLALGGCGTFVYDSATSLIDDLQPGEPARPGGYSSDFFNFLVSHSYSNGVLLRAPDASVKDDPFEKESMLARLSGVCELSLPERLIGSWRVSQEDGIRASYRSLDERGQTVWIVVIFTVDGVEYLLTVDIATYAFLIRHDIQKGRKLSPEDVVELNVWVASYSDDALPSDLHQRIRCKWRQLTGQPGHDMLVATGTQLVRDHLAHNEPKTMVKEV